MAKAEVLANKDILEYIYILQILILYLQLEAAIKAAQSANNRANQERLKWQEKIRELEIQQHQIQGKENELILRAKELENLTQVKYITLINQKKIQNKKFFYVNTYILLNSLH